MDISDLSNSDLADTMGNILSNSNQDEAQTSADNLPEESLINENIEVSESQTKDDMSATADNIFDNIESLSEQGLDFMMDKPSTSVESEELISSSNKDTPTSNIEEHEELWLGDNTRQLVKVEEDEDFEVIVKSLETAIVETERYDIETITSEEPVSSDLGITIEDLPITSTVPFSSQDSVEIPSPETSFVQNLDNYEEFATISEPKVESFDEQSSLFETIESENVEPSLLELQEATMPANIPEDFQLKTENVALDLEFEEEEQKIEIGEVKDSEIFETITTSNISEENIEDQLVTENSPKEENKIILSEESIEQVPEESSTKEKLHSKAATDKIVLLEETILQDPEEIAPQDLLDEEKIVSEESILQVPEESSSKEQKLDIKNIPDLQSLEEISTKVEVKTTTEKTENKIVLPEESILEEEEPEKSESENKNVEQEENMLQVPEKKSSKDLDESNNKNIQDVELKLSTDESENKIVLPEEIQVPEESSSKEDIEDDLKPATGESKTEKEIVLSEENILEEPKQDSSKDNLDENKIVLPEENQKDIQDKSESETDNKMVLSEEIILEPEQDSLKDIQDADNNKIVLPEELQVPEKNSSKENLDENNQKDIRDETESTTENKIVLSEEIVPEVSEQNSPKVDLDEINKKDIKDIDLNLATAESKTENKIVLTEENVLEVPEQRSPKDLDESNKKDTEEVDFDLAIAGSKIENKIVLPEENVLEVKEQKSPKKYLDEMNKSNIKDIDFDIAITGSRIENKIVLPKENVLELPEESSPKDDLNESKKKDTKDIDLDVVIVGSETENKIVLPEENVLEVPEQSLPKDNIDESNTEDIHDVLKPATNKSKSEDKIVLPKENILELTEESSPKEDLDESNKKNIHVLKAEITESKSENKIVLSEENILQVPEQSPSNDDLDERNKKAVDFDLAISGSNIEKKVELSEEIILEVPEQNSPKDDFDENNEKDIQKVDLKPSVSESKTETQSVDYCPSKDNLDESNKKEIPDSASKKESILEIQEQKPKDNLVESIKKDDVLELEISESKSENKIILPEENVLEVPEQSQKKDDLKKNNKQDVQDDEILQVSEQSSPKDDLDKNVKDINKVDLKPTASESEIENKMDVPEEILQKSEQSTSKDDLKTKNKSVEPEERILQVPEQSSSIDLESLEKEIPSSGSRTENKIVLPEENILKVLEQSPSKDDLDENNKKDIQDVNSDRAIGESKTENKIVLSDENILEVLEQSPSKDDFDESNKKDIQNVLNPAISDSKTENKIVSPEEIISQVSEERSSKTENTELTTDVKDSSELQESIEKIEKSTSLKHSLDTDSKDQSPPKRIKLVRKYLQEPKKDVNVEPQQKLNLDKEELITEIKIDQEQDKTSAEDSKKDTDFDKEIVTPTKEETAEETITPDKKIVGGKETIQELLAKLEEPEKETDSKSPSKPQKLKLQRNYKVPKKSVEIKQPIKTTIKEIKSIDSLSKSSTSSKDITKIVEDVIPKKTSSLETKTTDSSSQIEDVTSSNIAAKNFEMPSLEIKTSQTKNIEDKKLSSEEKTKSIKQQEIITELEKKLSEFEDQEMEDDVEILLAKEIQEDKQSEMFSSSKCEENIENIIETHSTKNDSEMEAEINIELQLDTNEKEEIKMDTTVEIDKIFTENITKDENLKESTTENIEEKQNITQSDLIESEITSNLNIKNVEDTKKDTIIQPVDKIQTLSVEENIALIHMDEIIIQKEQPEIEPEKEVSQKMDFTELEKNTENIQVEEKEVNSEVAVVESRENKNTEVVSKDVEKKKEIDKPEIVSLVEEENKNLVSTEVPKKEVIHKKENIKSEIKIKQDTIKQSVDELDKVEKSNEPLLKIDTQFPLLSSRLQEKLGRKLKSTEEVNISSVSTVPQEVSKQKHSPVVDDKISFVSRNPEITLTKETISSGPDHSATMESATKIRITKKRLGTPEPTRSITKPLSVQVDDLESSGSSGHKDSENMKFVIKSLKAEGRSSPKITIKPIKPPEESGKSRMEESSHSPKITIKPIVKTDPLKITITKQKSDDSHSILKIYQPEDSQIDSTEQHVPKLTIKPIQRDEMQHSPRITIKPVKPSPTSSSMSPKITVKPIPSPSEQVEIIHSPKITVKPVTNPEESYPKVTIKPVLRPEESHKVSQLSPRQIKLKSMTFESSSGVTVEPVCGTSPQKSDTETSPFKISVKSFAKIEETLSPKLTIKPITKTCEIVQSEDGTSNPLKLTIKPIMKPEEASYQSPKITIKPIVKPDDNSQEEIDKPERIILKIQKNNLPSPKERVKESKKEPEIKIEAIPHDSDKNLKLDKIKLKLTKEGSHAQIIPSVSHMSSETISLKRSLGLSDSGLLEKRSKTDFSGTELLHTSDISINLVEPNAKPCPKSISEEVTIMKIDKAGSREPVTEQQISQSRFKEMLMKIQQKPDITCTPRIDADPEYSSGSDDVKIVEVIEDDPLKDPLSIHDDSSSQDVMIVNEVINTNPFHNVQIINVESTAQTPKKRGRPRKNPLEVKPEIKGEDCVELEVRPKRTCRAPPGRTPFAVKERKPRGAGRGRGGSRGRGASKSPQKSPKETKTTPRSKALKEAKELAKIEAVRLAEEIVIDEITIEDSTNDTPTPVATPVPPVEDSPKKPDVKDSEVLQMVEPEVKQTESESLPPPPAVYEEETRMSADNSSRAQTPARQVFTAPLAEGPEESQSSVQSTATTESSKTKKGRLEVCDPDSAVTTVEQIVEYSWANGGPYMLQEQIAQFLGVKSFKRKYPGLTRRSVEMQERDYIREKGLVSESMCDMGLTAVPSSEILDIMFQDFQDKYEEYRKCLRDKQAKEISNKQKAVSLATSQEKNKIDFKEKAMRSAASWNVNFNKARKESRKCCMDLQTYTINYPAGKVKVPHKNPVGHYPLALVPGQFTDYFKSYTASELHYLPLNTVRYGPVLPNQPCEPGQSDGSQSDSDSSSGSDSDSSDESMSTEEDAPIVAKTADVHLTTLVTTPKTRVH